MNNYYNRELRERSRALRNHARSRSEKFLWKALLSRGQLGTKFKRQRSIGNYIVDFFAAELLLIVEIDGSSHLNKSLYDRQRQDWLEHCGYVVVRFSEKDVLNDFERVKTQLFHIVYCLKLEM